MRELKEKILQLCNESGLPLEAIIFVVKDVWRDAEATLQDALKQAEREQKQKEAEK